MTKKQIFLKYMDSCIKNVDPAICLHFRVNGMSKFEIHDNEYFKKIKYHIKLNYDDDLILKSNQKYKVLIAYMPLKINSYESIIEASNAMQENVMKIISEEG